MQPKTCDSSGQNLQAQRGGVPLDGHVVQVARRGRAAAEFDYGDAPPAVRAFLSAQAARIRRSVGGSIVAIGRELIAAKQHLAHGIFLRWVESEIGIPARTAQGYMQVAEWLAGKDAAVAQLPPSLLYVLSAPSTPRSFTLDILRRIEAGEHIRLPQVREELRELAGRKRRALLDRRSDPDAGTSAAAPDARAPEAATVAVLIQVVGVLARELSATDFASIRDLMTNSATDNPAVRSKWSAAFQAVDRARGKASQ
jgi:hypothetical protein